MTYSQIQEALKQPIKVNLPKFVVTIFDKKGASKDYDGFEYFKL